MSIIIIPRHKNLDHLSMVSIADVRPLYDQPLEMSGKRDRKKVERFVQETKKEEPEASGKGAALGDIPYINAMIMVRQQLMHISVSTLTWAQGYEIYHYESSFGMQKKINSH